MIQPLKMTYIEIRDLSEAWCEEAGIDRFDKWYYPFEPEQQMTVTQVLYRFICEGRMCTIKGMRGYFDRYLWSRNHQAC